MQRTAYQHQPEWSGYRNPLSRLPTLDDEHEFTRSTSCRLATTREELEWLTPCETPTRIDYGVDGEPMSVRDLVNGGVSGRLDDLMNLYGVACVLLLEAQAQMAVGVPITDPNHPTHFQAAMFKRYGLTD